MRHKFSDQVRAAIDASGMSRYAISKAIGLNQSVLSRFMRGGGLSLDTLDKLADLLGLAVVVKGSKRRKGG
jgi:transcriptional regulator with XRE-family HTH domain